MRFAARLILGIFVCWIFSFVFLSPVRAQGIPFTPNTNPGVPPSMHTYIQSLTLETLSSLICLLDGQDPTNPNTPCLGFDPTTHKIGYVKSGGLLGMLTSMTAALYTPPIHTAQYVTYMSQNFGLVKHAYAASSCTGGVGFCGISPLLGIWTSFRNIVYLFFVVIFILVGFGIMLRMKIDPRTVMSIENQIPKLIIALLLVTFSFAIAGLMIDGMWLGSFVAVNVLTSADTQNHIKSQDVNNNFFQNPIGFSNNVLPGGILGVAMGSGGSIGDVIKGLFTGKNSDLLGLTPNPDNQCHGFDPGCWFSNISGDITEIIGVVLGNALAFLLGILGFLVVLVAIIYSMFKLWFTLLLSYAYILLDIILGPFFILFGVFPGSKTGFGSWARDILANLMAFPTAIAMFLLGRLLMDAFTTGTGGASIFVTPLIGNPNGGVQTTSPLGFLIGLAIILLTPQVVGMVKGILKVQDNKALAGLGQAIGVGTGTLKRIGGGALNTAFGPQVDQANGMLTYKKGNLARIARALGWIR